MIGIHEQFGQCYYWHLYCQVLTEKEYKEEWILMALQAKHLPFQSLGVLSHIPWKRIDEKCSGR